MSEDSPAEKTVDLIQQMSDLFDRECQMRHIMGEEKYGPVKFMTVNSIEEAMAEIVDLANYARYTYIKLALLASSAPVESLVGHTPLIAEVTTEAPVPIPEAIKQVGGFFNPYRSQA